MAQLVVTLAPSGQAHSDSTAVEGFEELGSRAEVPAGVDPERERIGVAFRFPCNVSEK